MLDIGRLTAAADDILRRGAETLAVPGVVAAVGTADEVIYEGAFGVRSLATGTPVTPDTVFPVASLTKAVASTAVMQAVERGLVGLDDPLGAILPWLGEVKVLTGFGAGDAFLLRDPARPVTLRHLLSHTSGFAYDAWSPEAAKMLALRPARFATHDFIRMPLLFDPGTRWAYGTGIDWAGLVLEAVGGMELEPWLKANLFEPLGADMSWRLRDDTRARLAGRHQRSADGSLVALDPPNDNRGDFDSGGAGLFTTAAGYLKFIRMILNRGTLDGRRVLKEETVAMMADPSAAPDVRVTRLISTIPSASNDGEFFPGVPKRHGLAFMINLEDAPTGRSAGSLAWAGIANCYYWIDPKRNVGGVFMTQLLPFLDHRALPLFHELEAAVYAALD